MSLGSVHTLYNEQEACGCSFRVCWITQCFTPSYQGAREATRERHSLSPTSGRFLLEPGQLVPYNLLKISKLINKLSGSNFSRTTYISRTRNIPWSLVSSIWMMPTQRTEVSTFSPDRTKMDRLKMSQITPSFIMSTPKNTPWKKVHQFGPRRDKFSFSPTFWFTPATKMCPRDQGECFSFK